MTAPTDTTARVGRAWVAAYVLAMLGVAAGWFGPLQILLPAQAERLAGAGGKEALLALVTGWGALASLVANPVWGAVSDRGRSRWGRRRPVVVAGTVTAVGGFVVLASATTPAAMAVGWVVAQIGLNGPFAALAAMIADRVPERQRGLVGALFGIAQTLGVVLGTAVAVLAGEGPAGYVALAVGVPALVVAILLVHREGPVAPRPGGPGPVDAGPSPAGAGQRVPLRALRPTRAFAWAWTVRFVLNLVNALVLLYLYFYLQDGVGVTDTGTWVLVVTVVFALTTTVAAAVGGVVSDRTGRRRVFVLAGAVTIAVGAAVLATAPGLPVVIGAAVLVGAGWGLYVAVDLAILTQVLPDPTTRATMLGVGNVASALPQVLAPVVAAPVVTTLGGYPTLYGLAAALCALAVAALSRLRGVT